MYKGPIMTWPLHLIAVETVDSIGEPAQKGLLDEKVMAIVFCDSEGVIYFD